MILALMAFPGDSQRQEELLAYRFLTHGHTVDRDWHTVRIGQSTSPFKVSQSSIR
jgi:hypothetical protein